VVTTTGRTDEKHDRAVEDSFPASDPPASTGITGPRVKNPKGDKSTKKPDARDGDTRPKGTPTDERHATETAYQWEHQQRPRRR
jgi:hypothetical protein